MEKMLHAGNRLTAVLRGWLTVHGTNHKILGTGKHILNTIAEEC
jgi:hypothetical protein